MSCSICLKLLLPGATAYFEGAIVGLTETTFAGLTGAGCLAWVLLTDYAWIGLGGAGATGFYSTLD
jgi:hypothetical protein